MAEVRRRTMTSEERERAFEKALDQAALDRSEMEELVKFAYIAKHKHTPR